MAKELARKLIGQLFNSRKQRNLRHRVQQLGRIPRVLPVLLAVFVLASVVRGDDAGAARQKLDDE